MDSLTPNVSPLRQRMIEDMRMRKMGGKTQIAYIRAVRRLAAFLKRSPDTADADELRRFQLHMVDTGTSPTTINGTLSGLKFFFDVTLGRAELLVKMQPVPQPRRLPVVLSCEEVARLIAAAIRRATSSQLSTTGSLRGCGTGCILTNSSARPSVTSKKNLSPLRVPLIVVGEVPVSTM